jgi:hypothetical protein
LHTTPREEAFQSTITLSVATLDHLREQPFTLCVNGWSMIALNGFFLLGGCLGSTDLGSIPVDTMAFEEGVWDFAKPNMTIFNSNYWMIIILDVLL